MLVNCSDGLHEKVDSGIDFQVFQVFVFTVDAQKQATEAQKHIAKNKVNSLSSIKNLHGIRLFV